MAINSYVYAAFRYRLEPKEWWMAIKNSFSLMRGSVERWQPARQEFASVIADWEGKNITPFSPSQLLDGARTIFRAAAKYYTIVQTALPAASIAETFLGRFYNGLVKRKSDPEFTTLLFGFETMPVRAPLFTMASAVVTDIGGPLSHSSIVAREYGVPAVMAVHDATRAIKSGQMITVDGAKGTVTLESK